MIAALLRWLTGDLTAALERAYSAKLAADTDEKRLIADAAIADINRQIAADQAARDVRLATASAWEMRLITAVIAGCFTLHLLFVTLDTCFALGWRIPKYPAPFDQWQGAILLSFFGIRALDTGISRIAAAIRGRK
jgi:hypothetical protein